MMCPHCNRDYCADVPANDDGPFEVCGDCYADWEKHFKD